MYNKRRLMPDELLGLGSVQLAAIVATAEGEGARVRPCSNAVVALPMSRGCHLNPKQHPCSCVAGVPSV